MTNKTYLILKNNIVQNICIWDGNTDTWTPPTDDLLLVQDETISMLWNAIRVDEKITDFVLKEFIGCGDIGFTWDGKVLTTNEPKPNIPK